MKILLIAELILILVLSIWLHWAWLTTPSRRVISSFLWERFGFDVCWAHSAGGFRRTIHSWVSNYFTHAHCISCGINTRKDVSFT